MLLRCNSFRSIRTGSIQSLTNKNNSLNTHQPTQSNITTHTKRSTRTLLSPQSSIEPNTTSCHSISTTTILLSDTSPATKHNLNDTVLIIADHNNKKLSESTLHVVEAAKQLSTSIVVLVAGKDCSSVADKASKISGVTGVVLADNDAYKANIAENVTKLILEYHGKHGFGYLLTAGSASGKNIIPRVSAINNQPDHYYYILAAC